MTVYTMPPVKYDMKFSHLKFDHKVGSKQVAKSKYELNNQSELGYNMHTMHTRGPFY